MAIITESELEVRLRNPNNSAKGRTEGSKNLPDSLREIIGVNCHFEKASAVAQVFGIAPITAHEQKNGRGHADVAEKIEKKVNDIKGIVKDKAIGILLKSLNIIDDDEKLAKMKPRSALTIAKGMAEITDRLTEKNVVPTVSNQILIYSPEVQKESHFDIVEVEKVG